MTPMMTWGEMEGTPLILDELRGAVQGGLAGTLGGKGGGGGGWRGGGSGAGPGGFKVPEPPSRDQLARQLDNEIVAKKRAKEAASKRGRSPGGLTPGGGRTPGGKTPGSGARQAHPMSPYDPLLLSGGRGGASPALSQHAAAAARLSVSQRGRALMAAKNQNGLKGSLPPSGRGQPGVASSGFDSALRSSYTPTHSPAPSPFQSPMHRSGKGNGGTPKQGEWEFGEFGARRRSTGGKPNVTDGLL